MAYLNLDTGPGVTTLACSSYKLHLCSLEWLIMLLEWRTHKAFNSSDLGTRIGLRAPRSSKQSACSSRFLTEYYKYVHVCMFVYLCVCELVGHSL